MSHEVVLDLFEPRRGVQAFMSAEEVEQRVRHILPASLQDFPFKIDMAQQDPRPLNPIGMKDRQIYVYDAPSRSVSAEPLKDLLKHLPGKVAQCRIFATSHEHDPLLAARARGSPRRGPPRSLHQSLTRQPVSGQDSGKDQRRWKSFTESTTTASTSS